MESVEQVPSVSAVVLPTYSDVRSSLEAFVGCEYSSLLSMNYQLSGIYAWRLHILRPKQANKVSRPCTSLFPWRRKKSRLVLGKHVGQGCQAQIPSLSNHCTAAYVARLASTSVKMFVKISRYSCRGPDRVLSRPCGDNQSLSYADSTADIPLA